MRAVSSLATVSYVDARLDSMDPIVETSMTAKTHHVRITELVSMELTHSDVNVTKTLKVESLKFQPIKFKLTNFLILLTGKYCELSKKCSQCDRHGTLSCDPLESRCICRSTHGGELCEAELDPCLDKPCGEHGECVSNKIDKFECICEPGFKGQQCEKRESACDFGLCINGATCMLEQDLSVSESMIANSTEQIQYVCQCPTGFKGKHCEIMENMCASEPCQNGATCLPTPAGNFTCLCPVSHTGRTCEQKIDYCLTARCAHGSTCHARLNSYVCECPPGRFGRFCDEEQDGCLNNECKNGN